MAKIDRIGASIYSKVKDKVIAKLGLEEGLYEVWFPNGDKVVPNPSVLQVNSGVGSSLYGEVDRRALSSRESMGIDALVLKIAIPKTATNRRGYPEAGTWRVKHVDWQDTLDFYVVDRVQQDFETVMILQSIKGESAEDVSNGVSINDYF
jgi:hypothetical protein